LPRSRGIFIERGACLISRDSRRPQYARHLLDLRRNERQAPFADTSDVDLNMQAVARAEFGDDTARQDIEIQKALEHALQRREISLGEHPQAQELNRIGNHEYLLLCWTVTKRTRPTSGFARKPAP